eukprot:TRINITY_DN671_c0_g1_i1.p1 TRINITY_DN671_c0_g1~~TRINITY_DN671_c0_g1_i1.p1  ORF type:complete len:189 (+),score=44.01 TRINITY_DN671_c0_g1_i1:107-673(+)
MVWNNFSAVKPTPLKGQGKGGAGGGGWQSKGGNSGVKATQIGGQGKGGGNWQSNTGSSGSWQKNSGGGAQEDSWNKSDDSALTSALIGALLAQGGGRNSGKWRKGVDPSKTLWVGNLPDSCTYQDLLTHAKQVGNAKWAEVYKHKGSGTGAIGFASAEEATQALMALNGSMLGTSVIQCDAWAREQKK